MYSIDFTAADDNELKARRREFGLLQELLRKGFNPRTADESIIFGDVRKKIRGMSEANGEYCFFCGKVQTIPEGGTFNRILKPGGAALVLENEEHRLVTECIRNAPRAQMFDLIEDVNDLVKKFADAKKLEEEKPAVPAAPPA